MVWEARYRPSPAEKGAIAGWLEECEQHGPPAADNSDDRGNLTVTGPRSTVIMFRRFDAPGQDPAGYMLILSIG